MWFETQKSDASYCDASPEHLTFTATTTASADRVFDVFANGIGQTEWFDDFVAVRWTSGGARGVGTTREVELKLLTVRERFVVWEPGRRVTFGIDAITLPLVRAMMEDLRLTNASGRTRIEWTVHYTAPLWMTPFKPLARLVFGRMFRTSLHGLVRYVEANPG